MVGAGAFVFNAGRTTPCSPHFLINYLDGLHFLNIVNSCLIINKNFGGKLLGSHFYLIRITVLFGIFSEALKNKTMAFLFCLEYQKLYVKLGYSWSRCIYKTLQGWSSP